MRIRYVFSELGSGLRRNLTMTAAVIVTVWISLVLFGVGMLVRAEVNLAQQFWYDKVQVAVYLCNDAAEGTLQCEDGGVTDDQMQRVRQTLETSPDVDEVLFEDQERAYERVKEIYRDADVTDVVSEEDMQASFRVSLHNPERYDVVASAVDGLPGVMSVQDSRDVLEPLFQGLNGLQWTAIGLSGGLLVAAVLQISNTIRLTVYSRRREIGIMRLVGASNFYIQLPFVLEAVVAALLGATLACLTIALAPFGTDRLRDVTQAVPWIGWPETLAVMPVLVGVGVLLAVVASFVTLRKYLKV